MRSWPSSYSMTMLLKSYIASTSSLPRVAKKAEVNSKFKEGKLRVEKLTTINHEKPRRFTKYESQSSQCSYYIVRVYGVDSWTLKVRNNRRFNAFAIRCWRRLYRIPWTRKVRYEDRPRNIKAICDARGHGT